MSLFEIKEEREAREARQFRVPGARGRRPVRRWQQLGYPNPEAHMIVQRARMRRRRRKEPLFKGDGRYGWRITVL